MIYSSLSAEYGEEAVLSVVFYFFKIFERVQVFAGNIKINIRVRFHVLRVRGLGQGYHAEVEHIAHTQLSRSDGIFRGDVRNSFVFQRLTVSYRRISLGLNAVFIQKSMSESGVLLM